MDKVWTISRGPIEANEFDLKKAEAINVLLIRPIGILPTKVGDPVKPFALGLWSDIRALLNPAISPTVLRRATSAYTRSKRYLFATAQPDAKRHDLGGNPVSEVSSEDRSAAQERFLTLKGRVTKNGPDEAAPMPEVPEKTKADRIRSGLLPRKGQPSSP